MRCTIENKNLNGLRSVCMMRDAEGENKPATNCFVRIEVTENEVNIKSPYGEMTADSRICEPGVVFVPVVKFLDAIAELHTNHYIEIEASSRLVNINGCGLIPERDHFAFFDDHKDAPQAYPG